MLLYGEIAPLQLGRIFEKIDTFQKCGQLNGSRRTNQNENGSYWIIETDAYIFVCCCGDLRPFIHHYDEHQVFLRKRGHQAVVRKNLQMACRHSGCHRCMEHSERSILKQDASQH